MPNPAEAYESYIVPALFQPWADELVARAQPAADTRVLDVACGTGIVARRAAAAASPASLSAVDINPAFLAVAREAAAREGAAIEWHEAPAEALPLPDASVDVAFCQQGMQFFRDRQQGADELARVLDRGGRAAVATWQPVERHAFFNALHQSMQRHLGTAAAAAPFSLPDPAELGSLLTSAGFRDVQVEQVSKSARYPDPDRFLASTLDALMGVVAQLIDASEDDIQRGLEKVTADLEEPLAEHTEGDTVVLPWHANIATARR